jgi:hypothetical protein
VQAKTYAKSDGSHKMNFTSLEDISWLMEIDELPYSDELFPSSSVAALIFCTFLWLNILILIFTMLNIDKVYTWLEEQRKSWKNMYKASAGVLTFINLVMFGGDLTCVIVIMTDVSRDRSRGYNSSFFMTYLTIKLVLVVFISDLLVSCFSTSNTHKKGCTRFCMH